MDSRKKLLKKSRLYVIVDKGACAHRTVPDIAGSLKNSGAAVVQLRDKESEKGSVLKEAYGLKKLLTGTGILFIINDFIDIARIVDCDGIHLGQDDLPIAAARQLLGSGKIIGKSCHSLGQAVKAQKEGADYISIGPIYATPTKPEYKAVGLDLIRKVKKAVHIPFFAIGGVNEGNISRVLSFGAERIAVCRAVCRGKNIPLTIKKFIKILRQ